MKSILFICTTISLFSVSAFSDNTETSLNNSDAVRLNTVDSMFVFSSTKAKLSEFQTVLTAICSAEGAFNAEMMYYSAATIDSGWTNLGFPNINKTSENFNYTIETFNNNKSFIAKATLLKDIGDVPKDTYFTINDKLEKTSSNEIIYKYFPKWK